MAEVKRHGSLDIDHDPEHSKLQWKIQHVGWLVMLLLLLLGLAGLLGPGPLSERSVQNALLGVKYEHFLHVATPTVIEAELREDQQHPVLMLDQAYLRPFKIEDIHPTPERMSIQNGKYVVVFHPLDKGSVIQLHVVPETAGGIHGQLRLQGNASTSIPLNHFVYP